MGCPLLRSATQTEQTGRAHNKNGQENKEVDNLLQCRTDVVTRKTVNKSDKNGTDDSTRQTPHATEHDDHESSQDKILPHSRKGGILDGQQTGSKANQTGSNAKCQHIEFIDVDTHQGSRYPILGQRPECATSVGVLQEQVGFVAYLKMPNEVVSVLR